MYPTDPGRGAAVVTLRASGFLGMCRVAALVVAIQAGPASALEPRPKPADVGATIERGLGFLVKDALAWKAKHHCASCHHAALVIWALQEAKQRGHAVNEPVL